MKAIILAAGRGARLAPLTDHTPKPLIEVDGQSLIEHHINNLVNSGIKEIIVNVSYLAQHIEDKLGDGSRYRASIQYSREPQGALETGGGIVNALSLLDDEPFVAVNADIYTDYNFSYLPPLDGDLAHLVLIENPKHNPHGDFSLDVKSKLCKRENKNAYTYSGIALYSPELFAGFKVSKYSIVPIIEQASKNNQISGTVYKGLWHDIGTTERLNLLQSMAKKS